MRICSKCHLEKDDTEFYVRKSGVRVGQFYEKCKECYKERGRNYYNKNRERQSKLAILRRKKYKDERRKAIGELKNFPCMDCNKKFPPWVMDFDHRDEKTKVRNVSDMVITYTSNIEKLKEEIAKCDLVCANCHRERTHQRLINK